MPVPQFLSGTTLSAAAPNPAPNTAAGQTLALTSGTNVVFGTLLIVDNEAIAVLSVVAPYSPTLPLVARGQMGTRAVSHINGAVVGVYSVIAGFTNNAVPLYQQFDTQLSRNPFWGANDTGSYRDFSTGQRAGIAFASFGTSTAFTITSTYVIDVVLSRSKVSTGMAYLQGAASGNGAATGILYDKDGIVVATGSVGTTNASVNSFQVIPWTVPIFLYGPAQYFLGVQGANATDTIRLLPSANASAELSALITGGTYGVTPNLATVPTTFTTLQGPAMAYIY